MEEESFGSDQADEASESNQETLKEDRPYKCNQCEKSYRHAGSLVNHKKTHQIGLYTCLICQKEYSNPMGLKSHLRTHSEEKRFKCEQCGEAFRMSQQLYNHRKSSHAFYSDKPARSHKANAQPPSLVESSNLMSNLENYIAESMVPVDFSQLVTKYYQEETSQAEEPAKENRETGRVTTEPFRGEQNDGNPEEYRYKCNQCDKAYKHAGSLANHKQTHVVGVYQCAICFKEFSNLLAMKNHCRLHSDSKPRQRCKSPRNARGGLPLPSTDTLQNDNAHSTDFIENYDAIPGVSQVPGNQNCSEDNTDLTSPSGCHQDEPQTNSVVALQSSSAVQVEHDSVAPNFAPPDSESASDEHTKEQECSEESKMADLEDRPFKCLECGKSYRHAGSLINHKKTHQTGVYSCSLCSKQMFNMAALKNHFRAHFKSRPGRKVDDLYFHSASFSDFFQNPGDPFQCAICGDFFTNESDFLQHQELHTEEAVQKTCNDTQMPEETSELGKCWPENTQESQTHCSSSYTGAPSVSNVKTEVENPADQHILPPSRPEDPLVSLSKINPDPVGDSQDAPKDFDQLALGQTLKEEESSTLDEEGDKSAIDRPYKCDACGRTYRHKSSLINHKLTHKTGIYQCSVCPKQYSNLMALKNHLRFHSRSYAGRRGIFSRRSYPFFRGRSRLLQNKTSAVSTKLRDLSPEANTQTTSVGTLTPDSCSCGELFNCKEDFDSHKQICKNSSRFSSSKELSVDFQQNRSSVSNPHDVCKTPEKREKTGPTDKVLEDLEHGRRVYECDLCDKAYRHSGSLINHKRTHQIGDYMCPYCSRHVHNMAALKNHIRIHHKYEKGQPGDERNCNLFYTDLYYPRADNSNAFDCPRCEETFNNEEDLVAHQMVHIALGGDSWEQKAQHSHAPDNDLSMETEAREGEHCSSSNLHWTKNLEKGDVKVLEDDGNGIDYTCVECGEVYNSVGDLNTHKLTHQIGIYQCSFCPKEYPSLLALKSHFQSHTKPQVLRKNRKHIAHSAERTDFQNQPTLDSSYDCGHCGLAFSNEVDFHQHQVSHEKRVAGDSFHCRQREGKEPDVTFCMDSSEQELLRSIKSELEEPSANDVASRLSHICGFCGKTYDDLESLQAHSFTHSAEEPPPPENKVNILDTATENAQTLNEEENIETVKNEDSSESRPYSCKECGKSYRHGGSLVNHRKTHLVGNFQCLACFRRYPNMAAYQNHLRHHPDCKQQVSVSGHELKDSNLHNTLQPNSIWTISPPGISSPEHPDALALPRDFKPCIDTLSINNSCLDHSNTHVSSQVQKSRKIFRRRFLRKNKRNEVVSSVPFIATSTPIKDMFEGTDKSVNIRDASSSISSDYNRSSQTEKLSNVPPMEEDITLEKDRFPYLANSSPNREEVEIHFHQRPFHCEVCGRSYRHAGSLINHKQTHKTGIFRCSVCQKRFFNLMAMKNHNRIHFELKRHTCLDCGKAFRLRKQLETHQRIHWKKTAARKFGRRTRRGAKFRKFTQVQPKANFAEQDNWVDEKRNISSVKIKRDPASRPYQCQECGRSYRYAGSLCNHKKSHKTGPYCCSVCQKIYSNLMAMKNHERIHYDAKRHHCPQCGKTFKWKRQLAKHKLVHGRTQPGSQPLVKVQEASVTSGHQGRRATRLGKRPKKNTRPISNELKDSHKSSKRESVCTACGVLLPSNGAVKTHTCSQNGVKMLDSDNVAHKSVSSKEDEERPYRCQLCGRTYRHAASLVNHKKTHEKGIFTCPLCNKQFFNALAIKNHLCTHKGEKKFSCVECGKAFRSSRQLACHRRTHTGVGPFFCPTCNVEFSSRVTLKHHQRIHRESEDVPSQSSSRKETNLSKRIVSKSCKLEPTRVSLSVRKYECKQCGRSYLHASSLFNHQKTHKVGVYKCSDCFKEFFNLLAFKNHRRIHKFPCKECGKAFRIAGHLEAHIKTHEQDGSFTCTLCNKQFSRSSFEHHQTTHHGTDGDFIEPQPLSNLMVKVT
ncbi:zinc finger protein 646 [Gastrophryne carolinensis]